MLCDNAACFCPGSPALALLSRAFNFLINEQNKRLIAGKATFIEKFNEISDLPKDVFEK